VVVAQWTEAAFAFQTRVLRTASGNEIRTALRRTPRRVLTWRVGNACASDALVADWLVDHLGKRALWPLPHCGVPLAQCAARGAQILDVTGHPPALCAGGQALLLSPPPAKDWQLVRLSGVRREAFTLETPLARPAAAGSFLMPLVWGEAIDPAALNQLIPGVASGHVSARIADAPELHLSGLFPADPVLDGLPVWPDGNWHDDPAVTVEGALIRRCSSVPTTSITGNSTRQRPNNTA
jgi:hypothetical protein